MRCLVFVTFMLGKTILTRGQTHGRLLGDSRFDGGRHVQIFNQTEWLAHIALKGTFPLM
jgi:hypothetical protein